jgi:membrane associated rhomboid family serine protease
MQASSDEAIDARRVRKAIRVALAAVGMLWAIYFAGELFDLDLARFGIYPRRAIGIPGIALAPLIHGSFAHLLANSAPIAVLGTSLLYGYPRSAGLVIKVLYAGTGLGVWLFARDGSHVGASGLAFGMMFFVFTIGAIRWDRRAIALSMLAFFLYGGMVWGIFPTDPEVSFESHFFGALLGVVLAVLLRNRDPAPPQPRYVWEEGDEGRDEAQPGEPDDESAQGGPGPPALH